MKAIFYCACTAITIAANFASTSAQCCAEPVDLVATSTVACGPTNTNVTFCWNYDFSGCSVAPAAYELRIKKCNPAGSSITLVVGYAGVETCTTLCLPNAQYYCWGVRSNCGFSYSDWAIGNEFLLRVDASSLPAEEGMAVYPNPATDHVMISTSHPLKTGAAYACHISDLSGKVLQSVSNIVSQDTEIKLQIPPGYYVVNFTEDNRVMHTSSFLKQ